MNFKMAVVYIAQRITCFFIGHEALGQYIGDGSEERIVKTVCRRCMRSFTPSFVFISQDVWVANGGEE